MSIVQIGPTSRFEFKSATVYKQFFYSLIYLLILCILYLSTMKSIIE